MLGAIEKKYGSSAKFKLNDSSYSLFELESNPRELLRKAIKGSELPAKFSTHIKENKRRTTKTWSSIKGNQEINILKYDDKTLKNLQALGYLQ